MNLDGRAVQTHLLDPDGQDLLLLQPGEDPVQHARFAPAVHAGVDRVPVAKLLWQAAPFAPMFHHIEQGVEQLQIGHTHVAALARQTISNALTLTFCKLHALTLPGFGQKVN